MQTLLIPILLQIIIILAISRLFAALFKKIGQPRVVGEMLAGLFLGKSIFGLFFPESYNYIFPPESFKYLHILSQIGLIIFMFTIGLEVDLGLIRNKAKQAIAVSHVGIIVPFILGVLAAYLFYDDFRTPQSDFVSFALFVGIVMSITAFPVLIRILQEYNMTKTALGTMAITCAAVDDITIWLVLAVFIGVSKNSNILHILMIATFLLGIAFSRTEFFKTKFIEKIGSVSSKIFLPLFFTFSGLRTDISSVQSATLWSICIIIILFAVFGKLLGVAIMAKLTGSNWKDAFALGALMNARGLMSLIVLNIGYDVQILSKEIFTILIIMSFVTTMMAGPLLKITLKRVLS
ncbi:MAG: cation:proton antiporter [Bdellovibrionota bacterium]